MIVLIALALLGLAILNIWWSPTGSMPLWGKVVLTVLAILTSFIASLNVFDGDERYRARCIPRARLSYRFMLVLLSTLVALTIGLRFGLYIGLASGVGTLVLTRFLSRKAACKHALLHIFRGRCKCVICGRTRDEGRHEWHGCACAVCGKKRDEEHNWHGCKCSVCGKTRDEGHPWNGCSCPTCGKQRDEKHDWNGCKCSICGKTRDESHPWNGCKCPTCEKTRDEGHKWNGCKCTECYKVREEQHSWSNGRCAVCGKYTLSSMDEALSWMRQYKDMEFYQRPSLIGAIAEMWAGGDDDTKRRIVQGIIGVLRGIPPPPLNVANFSLICAAIAFFGRIRDDSTAVLDCLDSFVVRDPNYHAIETLGELAETSDAALDRLLKWHRRVDKAQVAGYALLKIKRESRAIVDSFLNAMGGSYDSYVQKTACEFFEKHPQYMGQARDGLQRLMNIGATREYATKALSAAGLATPSRTAPVSFGNCPNCGKKLRTEEKTLTFDEDLGGGRVVRTEKRVSRMKCTCGYISGDWS